MGKYREVREVTMNVLSDRQWHGIDEIQSKCEREGIGLEGDRGPIYNVVHQLKKKEKIEANGMGKYRMSIQNMECVEIVGDGSLKNQFAENIEKIEKYLNEYKKFDWVHCANEELQCARSNVLRLLELAQKIEKEFRKI